MNTKHTVSKYIIKVSNCRERGEYCVQNGDTLFAVRREARHMAKHCNGLISIVRYHFGEGRPEDGVRECVEQVA